MAAHPLDQRQQPMSMSMLPDEILVQIGTTVAKLCGIRDYVVLLRTCKHFKKLLMDSEETISEVVNITTSRIDNNNSYSYSSLPKPIVVRTLEEVALYESCTNGQRNLLEDNRILFDRNQHNPIRFDHYPQMVGDSTAIVSSIRTILRENPSASVVLAIRDWGVGWISSIPFGYSVCNAIRKGAKDDPIEKNNASLPATVLKDRIWLGDIPDAAMTREENGWVEIYFRLESPFPGAMPLWLPPYSGHVPERLHKHA